jgi:hypothetical protein
MFKRVGLTACLLLIVAPIALQANTIVFITPAGSTTSGGTVSAEADFTTGAGVITVNLKNLDSAAQMINVAQALSDLAFTISTTGGAVTDANRAYTSTAINVDGTGAVSSATFTANGWDFSGTGSSYLLEDLGSTAGPTQLILGGAGATSYPNANGSIAGNPGHNPFLQGNAMFTLTVSGVTVDTNITSATFSFGTGPGNTGELVPGVPRTVPEPRSVAMLAAGLLFFAAVYFRRKASPRS